MFGWNLVSLYPSTTAALLCLLQEPLGHVLAAAVLHHVGNRFNLVDVGLREEKEDSSSTVSSNEEAVPT